MPRNQTLRIVLLAVSACAAAPSPRPRDAPHEEVASDEAAALFAQWKAVTGGDRWDAVTTLETAGTLDTAGLSGEVSTLTDARTGRSTTHFNLGSLTGAEGFDGSVAWERDMGGEVRTKNAAEARRAARTAAWLNAMGYWYPARGRAALGRVTDELVSGRRYRVVVATPQEGRPVALWFDPASQLLVRTVETEGQDTVTTELSQYDTVAGLRWPLRSVANRTDASGRTDARQRVEVTTRHITVNVEVAGSEFAAPTMAATAHITGASAATGATRVPIDLVNNHIFADAFINGARMRVIVDTGGVNLLTPAGAKKLGIAGEGKLSARGAGKEQVDVTLAHASEVRLGDAVLSRPVFYIIDLGSVATLDGAEADGLVGFEMFRRFRVTVDYAAHALTLADPAKYLPPADAVVIPFELADRIPIVTGSLDGVPVRLSVDTGSRSSLTLNSPFVRQHALVAKYGAATERITGWGVGGPVMGRPARLGELALGEVTVRDIAGDLFTGDEGAFANPDLAGNLGGGVLRRFAITFDYDDKRMYLTRNADFATPDAFDRSGMWIMLDGDALKIAGVAAGGPAARAGLEANDRLTSVDGVPASQRTLADWRRRLAELPAGTSLVVSVASAPGREAHHATLVLADAIPPHVVIK